MTPTSSSSSSSFFLLTLLTLFSSLPSSSGQQISCDAPPRKSAAEMAHEGHSKRIMKAVSLPSINVSPTVTGNPDARKLEGKKLVEAFSTFGFCYVTGISGYQRDKLLKWTKWFHNDVPDAVKYSQLATVTFNPSNTHQLFRGYIPLMRNKAAFMQAFDVVPDTRRPLVEGEEDNFYQEGTPRLELPGREEEVEEFYQGMMEHHAILTGVANLIMSLIAESGGERSDYFASFPINPHLRVMRYPQRPKDEVPEIAKLPDGRVVSLIEHADATLVTLVETFGFPGLEIKLNGSWFSVPPNDDALVVNVGEMLTKMSNGRFKSTIHRVVLPEDGGERYSIPFFVHPDHDANINIKVPRSLLPENDENDKDNDNNNDKELEYFPFASIHLRKIKTMPYFTGLYDRIPDWMRRKYLSGDDLTSSAVINSPVVDQPLDLSKDLY